MNTEYLALEKLNMNSTMKNSQWSAVKLYSPGCHLFIMRSGLLRSTVWLVVVKVSATV